MAASAEMSNTETIVISLRDNGLTLQEISHITNVSKSTVCLILMRQKQKHAYCSDLGPECKCDLWQGCSCGRVQWENDQLEFEKNHPAGPKNKD